MIQLLLALMATVALGIVSRLYPIGWSPYDKSLGDVLYAMAAYLALALALLRPRPVIVAVCALACCLAIELFKLTGIPAAHRDSLFVRWLLGSSFSWHNLACYLLGVLLIAGMDAAVLRGKSAKK